MLRTIARNALWLIGFALALALLTPWHALGAASVTAADVAPTGTPQHRTECPLYASHVPAAPAQARKAAPTPASTGADFAQHERVDVASGRAWRPTAASHRLAVSSLPVYLVNLRLLR